jgi:nodulation protein A
MDHSVRWEGGFSAAEHEAMARLLGWTLGQVRAADAEFFVDGRSWAGARPEFRLLGHDDQGLAAHIGVLRRFLRIGNADVAVADLGLFAVRPDSQRHKLGSLLLSELHAILRELTVPFGFLNCRPGLIGFYQRNGWHLLPGETTVRQVDPRDPGQILEHREPSFILPVTAGLEAWPAGTIDRNGWEV